jgi:hypothetical protein
VNSSTQPLLKITPDFATANGSREQEIESVVHQLRDQACTLSLGISALQYRDGPEQERRQHVAVLEGVVEEMNRQFQRLDQWLIQVGYKPKLDKPSSLERARRMRKRPGRA